MNTEKKPVRIFIAYSSRDIEYKEEIRKRFKPLQRAGKVFVWDNYHIEAGADWDAEIRENLEQSNIILLLLSPDALDSDYFYDVEAPIALRRHKTGEAIAVGILLRPCALKHTPLGDLTKYELLPKKAYPIIDPHWPNIDAAYFSVFEELDRLIESLEDSDPRIRTEIVKTTSHTDPFSNLMIAIKGGTYSMGDTFSEGCENEIPVHLVNVKDFYLCKYLVSQGQWKKIMKYNPSFFKGNDNLPVEQVSWDDTQIFIKRLNDYTGKNYRLPTEAEWEYAAREGGKKLRFGNGQNIANPTQINFNANEENKKEYSKSGKFPQKTTPVDFYQPNSLGLHDMSGNVWEWCEDMWHHDYKGAPTGGAAWYTGGDRTRRVIRGGAWNFHPEYCRISYRAWDNSGSKYYNFGFRLAL